VNEDHVRGQPPPDAQDEQVWDIGLIGRVFCSVPLLAFATLALIESEALPISKVWPFFVVLVVMTVVIMRPAVRLTQDELVIRHPIGSERIPRAEVASAKFNYFGLMIRGRDGGSSIAFIFPRWTSTELSGDEPQPDSAAYQITRWAQLADPGPCPPGVPGEP
jgi:hypothetical protein